MRTRRAWIPVVVLALALGACGDDDTPSVSPEAGDDGFCARASELADHIATSVEGVDDLSGDETLERLRAQIAVLEQLASAAPAEIRDDVETLVELSSETVTVLEDDDAGDQDELTRLDEIDEQAAAPRSSVEDFVADECGVELNPESSEDAPDDGDDLELPEPPDPCELATADEVAAIVGAPVEDSGFTGNATIGNVRSRSCTLNAQTDAGLVSASISTLSFTSADEARAEYEAFVDVTDADVDGLPASSFRTSVDGLVTIWVVDAATPFGVAVSVTTGDELVDRTSEAEALALTLYEPA